eukprot:m.312080 g.312080  ORF g.312080 m.312080 type:complete len:352 (+) comp208282_c0_seq1:3-1058(+)
MTLIGLVAFTFAVAVVQGEADFDFLEFKLNHIDTIKKQVLEQLGLQEPPNVTEQMKVELLKRPYVREELDRLKHGLGVRSKHGKAKSTEVIPAKVCSGSACKFSQAALNKIDPSKILHIQLHIYKLPTQTKNTNSGDDDGNSDDGSILTVTKLRGDNDGKILAAQAVSGSDKGWVRTPLMKGPVAASSLPAVVRISHKQTTVRDCPGRHCPYLTITHTEPAPQHQRGRRATEEETTTVDCHRRDNGKLQERCCRMPLTITLEDLGWSSWVFAPSEFEAFFCKGSCPKHYKPASRHASITSLLAGKYKRYRKGNRCCSPTSLSSVTLIHFSNSGEITSTEFENLSVENCGCS